MVCSDIQIAYDTKIGFREKIIWVMLRMLLGDIDDI